jgi:hypothetical protein
MAHCRMGAAADVRACLQDERLSSQRRNAMAAESLAHWSGELGTGAPTHEAMAEALDAAGAEDKAATKLSTDDVLNAKLSMLTDSDLDPLPPTPPASSAQHLRPPPVPAVPPPAVISAPMTSVRVAAASAPTDPASVMIPEDVWRQAEEMRSALQVSAARRPAASVCVCARARLA